jgi:uncharacterized membrane protein YbhN (UPF0104 family)
VLLWVELPSHELVVAGMSIDILAWGWSTAQVLIPSITIAVVVLAVAGEPLVDLLEPLFLRVSRGLGLQRFAGRLVDFSRSFARSFRALRSPRRLGAALALSAAIWAEIALMFWVLAFGFELDHIIGFAQSAGVMTITALGALLPAPPAMAGVQEAFGRGALALFGAHGPELDATCLGYAVVAHWWQYLLNGLGALFFAAKEKVGLRELLAAPQQTLHDEASS